MSAGILYIIATPIGNMEDITYRAVRILQDDVDIVYCEDTRQSRKLLNHYGINKPAYSLHTHSSREKIENIIVQIQGGATVAYVTDSGTPGISDPGSKLVAAAREHDIPVCPIPGASALAAIVSVSGYHGKEFAFAGFLSKKEGRRKKELAQLGTFRGMIILYESPYRIKKLINAIGEIFPGKRVLIAREMTKLYEEFICDTVENIIAGIDKLKEKGEFAVAIFNDEGVKPESTIDNEE